MKKSLKQALLSTAVLSLLVYSGTATVNAAYELSSEVAKPSASLMRAAEIGLRTHENAALQQLPSDRRATADQQNSSGSNRGRARTFITTC